jgi:hypothetical protein
MEMLRCEKCLESHPAAHFTNRDAGLICTCCKVGIKTELSEAALTVKAKELATKFAEFSPDDVNSLGRLRDVMANIYGNFGGTTGFANFLHGVIVDLSNRTPVPSSVGLLMISLMKLHHTIELSEELVHARELTDDQLKRETELATIRLVVDAASDPSKKDMLNTILGKHGYAIKKSDPAEVIDSIARKVDDEDRPPDRTKE